MSSLLEIAELLKKSDKSIILTHQYPDGDTLGSAFGLCRALRALGKQSRVLVNGVLPKKYEYLCADMEQQDFEPETVIAVDIASASLLGDYRAEYEGKTDICIDHHLMNVPFAKETFVDAKAAANTENIFALVKLLGVEIDKYMADCIYTGLCTDTGCFKFSNVTPRTMRMAADLMELGCQSAWINRVMFDTKSMARIRIERAALNTLAMYSDNRIAVLYTTLEMEKETGATDADMDGLASISRQIEGVLIGITIKEKAEGRFKVSVRTIDGYNAADICSEFGGGGHHAAGGCAIEGTIEEVRAKLVSAAEKELAKN